MKVVGVRRRNRKACSEYVKNQAMDLPGLGRNGQWAEICGGIQNRASIRLYRSMKEKTFLKINESDEYDDEDRDQVRNMCDLSVSLATGILSENEELLLLYYWFYLQCFGKEQ